MSIHNLELQYTIFAVDAADALVTWREFYEDCKKGKFTKRWIRGILHRYYGRLSAQIAREREIAASQMRPPYESFWESTADMLFEHYEEERLALLSDEEVETAMDAYWGDAPGSYTYKQWEKYKREYDRRKQRRS